MSQASKERKVIVTVLLAGLVPAFGGFLVLGDAGGWTGHGLRLAACAVLLAAGVKVGGGLQRRRAEEHAARVRAETALRESQTLLDAQLNSTIDGILVVDPQGRKILQNRRCLEMWGIPQDIAANHSDRQQVEFIKNRTKDPATLVERIAYLYSHPQEIDRHETELKDGTILDCYSAPVTGADGAHLGRIWLFRDVTAHKHAQAELEALSARNEALLRTVPDIITEVDRDKVYTWANQAGRDFFGDDLVGREAAFYFEGEQNTYTHVQPLFNGTADVFYVESWQRRRDGAKRLLAWWCRALKDANGNVTRVLSTARDITEDKQAQEALRKSEAQLSNAMEIARLGPWELDVASGTFTFTDSFYAIFRTTAQAMGGYQMPAAEYARRFVHPEDAPQVGLETRKALEAEDPHFSRYLEHRMLYADGSVGHIAVRFFIVKDRHGKTIKTYGVNQDITERKQVEQKQAQLLEQLTAANQELKDFAYVVSHDLKAPLRAIGTLADWLVMDYQDKLDDEGRENLRLLGGRVERMQNLIDGVLQYSRVGRTEQRPVPVDLARLVPEIVANLGVPEHIAMHVSPGLPTIEADATRITQVFQNLLSNAVKYLDKPQGQVAVDCVEEDGFWKFSVADNGPGIEEKYFERIFKLFQTLTPRDSRESTGVGLTITKKIVEMYGGRIWVESQVGQGSTFCFTWPRHPAGGSPVTQEAGVPEPADVALA